MRKSQRGASYLGIFFWVIVFALVAKAAIALAPAYLDDRIINNQIEELLRESTVDTTVEKFDSQMNQRLDMNNIRDLNFKEIAKVTRNKGGLHIVKEYEVRKPFLLNIDLVLKFEKSFDQNSVQAQ